MKYLSILVLFLLGCNSTRIISEDEHITRMYYTNSVNKVIPGYFVPDKKMIEFSKIKRERDYYKKIFDELPEY